MAIKELYQAHADTFETFCSILKKGNAKVNLVSNRELLKLPSHVLDSLLLASPLEPHTTVCDLGSGGGFPVIPLAIVHPSKQFTAIDSSERKCDFLFFAAQRLGLSNLVVEHQRIEDATKFHKAFDAVTARALAPLKELVPLAAAFLRDNEGTELLFLKGGQYEKEVEEAQTAFRECKVQLISTSVHTDVLGRDTSVVLQLRRH